MFRHGQFFTALLLSVGIGLFGYYAVQWLELPQWSEADLEASAELNLALDLKRMGPHLQPDPKRLEELRALVRRELDADIAHEREQVLRGLVAGLFALIVAFGHWRFTRAAR